MTLLLYALQRFWQPLLVLVIAGGIWAGGYHTAKQGCRSAALKAENAELVRQSRATKTVLEKAVADGAARQAEINRMKKESETYESDIKASDRFILFGADAGGLRRIK